MTTMTTRTADAQSEHVAVHPRMRSPGTGIPEAWEGIQKLLVAVRKGGVPESTLHLSHLRASQINGCAACLESGWSHATRSDEPEVRLFTVAAWRDSPHFTAAERAALALTEAVTRLCDRPDPVPDAVWQEAARHYDEVSLGALILHIALTNLFNRLNVSTRQLAGAW